MAAPADRPDYAPRWFSNLQRGHIHIVCPTCTGLVNVRDMPRHIKEHLEVKT